MQSISKSLGALISMLLLANEYGDEVFDLRIIDYLDINAEHDGWRDVTFGDALNMATGIGDAPVEYAGVFENGFPPYRRFRGQLAASGKLEAAFTSSNYPWGPGEVFRYRDMDSFVLAAAMDGFLKSEEGPAANMWDRVQDKVLQPLGIHVLPMNHTIELDGSRGVPLLSDGILPTFQDLSRIAVLLQNRGNFDGVQLLSATKIDEAFYRTDIRGNQTPQDARLSGVGYHMSLWHPVFESDDWKFDAPMMSGMGGNSVVLFPSRAVGFYLQDGGEFQGGNLARAIAMIGPEC